MNRVNGKVSEAEARRRQFQNYQLDKKKHAEKEKEKLDKKKLEKWKRYEHIDTGVKLPDVGQSEDVARAKQQSVHDDKVINYIIKLERENARLRAEEEERLKGSPQAAVCSSTISSINQEMSPRSSVGILPFDLNSVANSPSLASSSISSPCSSIKKSSTLVFEGNSANVSSKLNVNSGSVTTPGESETEKMKQEMHKRKMESVRENMQKLYSQSINKED